MMDLLPWWTFRSTFGLFVRALFARVVDGDVTATGVLSRQRGNLITTSNTQ